MPQGAEERLARGILHATSPLPGAGYRLQGVAVSLHRRVAQDPFVVWLPHSELYVMFFTEVECDPGVRPP